MRPVRILSTKSEDMDGQRVGVGVCCLFRLAEKRAGPSFHVFLVLLLACYLETRRINALAEGPPT